MAAFNGVIPLLQVTHINSDVAIAFHKALKFKGSVLQQYRCQKKDIYHNAVRFALVKHGWEILTEDYSLEYGGDRLYVDIAAEKSM
ncbi:element excision factor XisH family protein [Nostoc sp. DedQUE04]|uniref:element excision factor XisH family protein n=1 Tax=Nostoc sp. DedQUE04 TaxID=3075390 RepID=UPI002AD3779B|nr:element excision factor XisH family protein [Nostoc sp. DedQUE04]